MLPHKNSGDLVNTLWKKEFVLIEWKFFMIYVYALWSWKYGKTYVGMSGNPDQRLQAHNKGWSSWSSQFRPWERFYLMKFDSRLEARKHEKYLKSGWGRKKLMRVLEEWQKERSGSE